MITIKLPESIKLSDVYAMADMVDLRPHYDIDNACYVFVPQRKKPIPETIRELVNGGSLPMFLKEQAI